MLVKTPTLLGRGFGGSRASARAWVRKEEEGVEEEGWRARGRWSCIGGEEGTGWKGVAAGLKLLGTKPS